MSWPVSVLANLSRERAGRGVDHAFTRYEHSRVRRAEAGEERGQVGDAAEPEVALAEPGGGDGGEGDTERRHG